MTQHTQGALRLPRQDEGNGGYPAEGNCSFTKITEGQYRVYGPNFEVVCDVATEQEARLIAAAPKLLEALTWAEMMIDNLRNRRGCGKIEGDDCQRVCKEAISAATVQS